MKHQKAISTLAMTITFLAVSVVPVLASCQDNISECEEAESACSPGSFSSDCIAVFQTTNATPAFTEIDCITSPGDLVVRSGAYFCYWKDPKEAPERLGTTSEKQLWCSCSNCPPGTIPSFIDPNCEGGKDNIGYLISQFIPLVPIGLGLGVLVGALVNGFAILTAGDNEEKKQKGMKGLANMGVGAGVIAGAVILISVLEAIFKVKILYGFGG